MSCRLYVIASAPSDRHMYGLDITELKPYHLQTLIDNVEEDDKEMLTELVEGQFTSPGAVFAAMATHLGTTKVGKLAETLS